MSRELQYGDPVIWCEMRPARGRQSKKQALVGYTRRGVFRHVVLMRDGTRVAVVETRTAIEIVNAELVTVDEEALAKRGAAPRGMA